MIRVKKISIEEFRGIRRLDLDLHGRNFGICGPNGTGKSGVVDAIEFCLTGDITRLSGEGTAGLSMKNHAPHVDHRVTPEKAKVTITAEFASLGKTVRIRRTVASPNKPVLTPDGPDVRNLLKRLEAHPELALSRREIVKYILTPPGRRSEDVQNLLRLHSVERIRKSLTTFCNRARTKAKDSERHSRQAARDFRNGLGIETVDSQTVLNRVNDKRSVLGLEPLDELTEETSFKAGLTVTQDSVKDPVVRKDVALADVEALRSQIERPEPSALVESRGSAVQALERLRDDEQALRLLRQYNLVKTGLGLVTHDACPLCDTPWNADELRDHLRRKLLSAGEIEGIVTGLRANINILLERLVERIQGVERTIEYCKAVDPPVRYAELTAYVERIRGLENTLKEFLAAADRVAPALQAVTETWWQLGAPERNRLAECENAIRVLPDRSNEDKAREVLIVAQERYDRLVDAKRASQTDDARSTSAQSVLDHYNTAATTELEKIYDTVADDFTSFYRAINHDDEDGFVGQLKSQPAKLSFNVDFYGRGLFPPGAYHSEGHQDAMGICLYLALMKHTLGDDFTFAVLDDVLMSVDSGHRRHVCRLLKSKFPNTQFILTTHDRVWLQYMKTEGLISRSQTFGGWTVDAGPRIWDDHDIWTEITTSLDKNNVHQAAWLLRRYLEYTAFLLADNSRAPVAFKADGRYGLGDLLPAALKQWKKRLKDGEQSARYWEREDEETAIAARVSEAKELIERSNAEQWTINPAVHFNEWENLQADEFREVVHTFRLLLESTRCKKPACGSFLYVLPRTGQVEEMRCNCGETVINLKKKA